MAKCGSPSFQIRTDQENVKVFFIEYDPAYLNPREDDPEDLELLGPATEKINLSP